MIPASETQLLSAPNAAAWLGITNQVFEKHVRPELTPVGDWPPKFSTLSLEKWIEAHTVYPAPDRRGPLGRVYAIEATEVARVKIGWTGNLPARLSSLPLASPVRLRVLAARQGYLRDERKLHSKFSHLRVTGEWFAFADDLRAFLKLPNWFTKKALAQ